jgi:hypothetical protein
MKKNGITDFQNFVSVRAVFKSLTAQAVGRTGVNRIIQAVSESHRAACAAAFLKNRANAYKIFNLRSSIDDFYCVVCD